MKPKQQSKEYKTPQFQFVRQDKSNSVFFSPSGGPGPKTASATLSRIENW